MKFIIQFLIIIAFAFVGEVLHAIIPMPVPASIYGIALLFIALTKGWIRVKDIREVSMFLANISDNLSICFILMPPFPVSAA